MSEYISREEVYQKLHEAGGCGATDEWSKGYDEAIGVAIGIIEDAPVADAAPVVHGHWVKIENTRNVFKCSRCGHIRELRHIFEIMSKPKLCEECGAKMDESEDKESV